jgi:hypothetical protein
MGVCTHNTVVAPFLAFRASCSNAPTCGTRVERLSRITASVKRWVPFARFLRYVRQCCGNNIGPEKLLKVIKNPISDHLPPGARRIGATPLSELVTLSCVHVRLHDRVQPHATIRHAYVQQLRNAFAAEWSCGRACPHCHRIAPLAELSEAGTLVKVDEFAAKVPPPRPFPPHPRPRERALAICTAPFVPTLE